ncbi:MAG: chemotaxis protein CheW [Verrucomicrobiota bacterium]
MASTEAVLQNKMTLAHPGKYLTFVLQHESYGIEVLKVREIIKLQEVTHVPQMPAYMKGVLNLRGKIIPVLDLRIKFKLSHIQDTESTCIIVVHAFSSAETQTLMGIIVDGVEEVLYINQSEIEDTPHFGSSLQTNYIIGMAKIKGSVKTLLDIDKVISFEDIAQIRQATSL